MKAVFQNTIFLILLLSPAVRSAILTQADKKVPERMLGVVDILTNQLKDAPNGIVVKIHNNECPPYDPKNKEEYCSVCAKYDEKGLKVEIEFRSPISRFDLVLENVDLDNAASDIKIDIYIKEYLNSLNEIVVPGDARNAVIDDAIKKGAEELGATDVNVAADKITYTFKSRTNTISVTRKDDSIDFQSDFYHNSVSLAVPKRGFIQKEMKNVAKQMILHLSRVQTMSLGDGKTAGQSTKTLDCESLLKDESTTKDCTDRLTAAGLSFSVEGNVATMKKEGGAQITFTCAPVQVGDFGLLELKGDFSSVSPNIQPNSQTFLAKSLYDLVPIYSSFMSEMTDYAMKLMSDNNPEEAVEEVPVAQR